MKLGAVYFWDTDKAEGYETRRKYHIFICASDGIDDNTFLFINSVDWYQDFKLLKANYEFLSYDSFVSCGSVVSYTDDELKAFAIEATGQLTNVDLKSLRDSLIAAGSMETRDLNRVCKALATAL